MMGDIDMGVFSIDGLEWLVPNVGMYWVSLPGLLNSFEEVRLILQPNGWDVPAAAQEVAAENGIDLRICPSEFTVLPKSVPGPGEDPSALWRDFKGKGYPHS